MTDFDNAGRTDYDGGRTVAGDGGFANSSGNSIHTNYGNNGNAADAPSPKPNNFLVGAILSTIFCCLPFGIVSIVYASMVDGLWYAGRYTEAQDAASKARKWFWWSLGAPLLAWIVYIIVCVVAVVADALL